VQVRDLAFHWKQAFPFQTRALATSLSRALHSSPRIAAANRKRIEAKHGRAAFAASLARCLGHKGAQGVPILRKYAIIFQDGPVSPARDSASGSRASLLRNFCLTLSTIIDIYGTEFTLEEASMSNATKHDLIVGVSKSTGLTQADTKLW